MSWQWRVVAVVVVGVLAAVAGRLLADLWDGPEGHPVAPIELPGPPVADHVGDAESTLDLVAGIGREGVAAHRRSNDPDSRGRADLAVDIRFHGCARRRRASR